MINIYSTRVKNGINLMLQLKPSEINLNIKLKWLNDL